MFLDNLGAHHAKETKAACQELKINMIFNAAYQHDMTPIEMVFNLVKLRFKQAKLHAITNKLPFDNDALIVKAFNQVTKEQVKRMCKKSWEAFENIATFAIQ